MSCTLKAKCNRRPETSSPVNSCQSYLQLLLLYTVGQHDDGAVEFAQGMTVEIWVGSGQTTSLSI